MTKEIASIMLHKVVPKYSVLLTFFFLLLSCKGQDQQNMADGHHVAKESILKGKSENPKGGVYCGFLDKEGSLWFGTTNEGVFKFNGTSFTHFSELNGLCNNKIASIAQDKAGNIWFGTANGICIFDGKAFNQLAIPKHNISTDWLKKSYPVVNPNEVQSIVQAKNGIFWIGTNGAGAYRYDGKAFTSYLSEIGEKQPDSLFHNIIQSISEDKDGNIWFTSMTHGGVSKYDGENFTQFMPKDGLSDDMVRTSFVDRKGTVWFGFNGNRNSGLTYYDGSSFYTFSKADGLLNTNIRGIYEDKKGNIWLGSGRGNLSIFDGKTFADFTTKDGQRFDGILFILEDAKENVWFGGKNGLWKFAGETVTDMTK